MNSLKKFRSFTAKLTTIFALTASNSLNPTHAQVVTATVRPESFKVTFYEVGIQNSITGSRSPIFKNDNGEELDIANPGALGFSRLTKPSNGTYDQVYVLVKNSVKVNSSNNPGGAATCFTRGGASSSLAAFPRSYAVTTANPALRGEATTEEIGFGAVGQNGPETPRLIGSLNGSVRDVTIDLVSSSNPVRNGGGAINRYLYTGIIGATYKVTDSTTGTIAFHFDTSQGLNFLDGCAGTNNGTLKVNLVITTNAERAN